MKLVETPWDRRGRSVLETKNWSQGRAIHGLREEEQNRSQGLIVGSHVDLLNGVID